MRSGPAGGPDRADRFPRAWPQVAVFAVLVLAVPSIALVPGRKASVRLVSVDRGEVGLPGAGAPRGTSPAAPPQAGGGPNAAVVQKPGLRCAAGQNGGATDVGVTARSVLLGATMVESGIGASFLADVRLAMQAVKNKINRAGGVCGRRIELKLVDDGWDFRLGGEFIRNLVEQERVFALAVVPSSEGLDNVAKSGYLDRVKVPVVGSDGMLISQYTSRHIWPIAASTISTMHIMAKQAVDAGAKRIGIVYDSNYHFGTEGAYAFNAAVKRLLGHDIPGYSNPLTNAKCQQAFCGIEAGAASYTTNIQTFNRACAAGAANDPEHHCDFIALLLEPSTAKAWLSQGGIGPSSDQRVGGPQPLFNTDFATSCGSTCDGMWVWTGYYPPLGQYLTRPAVAAYVNDIRSTSSSADYSNTFVEGGYVGMMLVWRALEQVGPNLTRENLASVLDRMNLDAGLSDPLSWRPGKHFASTRMRAFSIQFRGGFAGFRDEQVTVSDPWVGQDIPR